MGTDLNNFPKIPLIIPINPHEITCQTVQIPIPNNILDKNVIKIDKTKAEIGPKIIPQIMIIAVKGCTFGKKTNKERPTTPSPANIASNVSLYVFTFTTKPVHQNCLRLHSRVHIH